MLAITPEYEVTGTDAASRPDLRGLLPEQRSPERELALALQCRGLGVDATNDDQVFVDATELGVVDVSDIRGEEIVGKQFTTVLGEKRDGIDDLEVLRGGNTQRKSSLTLCQQIVRFRGRAAQPLREKLIRMHCLFEP